MIYLLYIRGMEGKVIISWIILLLFVVGGLFVFLGPASLFLIGVVLFIWSLITLNEKYGI
jgi:hypothetical protein